MSNADNREDSGQAVEMLLQLARLVEVTDHVRGRIEARVSLRSLGEVLAILRRADLERTVRLIPGLIGYEVSAWSRSAIIQYDPTVIPAEFWNLYGTVAKDPSVEPLVRAGLIRSLSGDTHELAAQAAECER